MRSLVLLALATLAAFPLSAHEHWRGPRRVVVIEEPRCAPRGYREARRWEDRRWEDRWDRHAWARRHACEDDRVLLRPLPRPLAPPFVGQVELYFR